MNPLSPIVVYPSAAKRLERIRAGKLEATVVPRGAQAFYDDFGHLEHQILKDKLGNPLPVTKLAPYQIEAWEYPGHLMVVKPNKSGMTTSFSIQDFQTRLLPEHAGHDVLLVGQSVKMANEHIRDLKTLIRNSTKYRKYLIEKPEHDLFKEDATKVSQIAIRNPYNSNKISRIIGIGKSEATAYSWKNIDWVHMSDPSLLPMLEQKAFFGALYTRLTNTNGKMRIETVPNGQQGEIWDIYSRWLAQQITDKSKLPNATHKITGMFRVMLVQLREVIAAGLVTQEFLDMIRAEVGDLIFSQLYENNFVASGNQWYKPDWITRDNYAVGMY